MALGGAHLPDERAYGVGVLVHDWLDNRRSGRRAPMNLDQALNLAVLIALVAAIVALVVGEVIQRWRRR